MTIPFNVIIVAAGSGSRMGGDLPKQYLELSGVTILRKTIECFRALDGLQRMCVVINPEHQLLFEASISGLDNIEFVAGGSDRKDSVYNGLKTFSDLDDEDVVLVHDAARPFVEGAALRSLLSAIKNEKAASLAAPVSDTLRYGSNHKGDAYVDRDDLWAMQTPQAAQYSLLRKAHEVALPSSNYTDDTALLAELGVRVKLVQSTRANFKITTQEDYILAQKLVSNTQCETFIGQGFDVHAFDDSTAEFVTLCGVRIPSDRKLKGHSDADVGLHALTDAIYGALGDGDIGTHFPPSDDTFKNMDSSIFLKHAVSLIKEKSGHIINVDVTLICEEPKIGPYREAICARLEALLNIEERRISVKATTTEKLGFTGRGEGIAAQAVVSLSLPINI